MYDGMMDQDDHHAAEQQQYMMMPSEEEHTAAAAAVDMAEVMMDMAAPAVAEFAHRWLSALNDAFPEQTATWTTLAQDLESVAQYCVLHYRSPAACLTQQADMLGALIVTPENVEFLPGLSAHDLFNQHHVSRATRQSMVSYTQCMYALVGQWSGDALAAEYEAQAEAHAQQPPPQNQFSTARYADLFAFLLERSERHQTAVETGVAAIDAFLNTPTGQWISVVVVRQVCAVHTDALCELCAFIEDRLHVNVGDRGCWTPQLLQLLVRKVVGLMSSSVRRAHAWSWFEAWFRWFGPGSPIAFVTRDQLAAAGGRGILYPDTFATDLRGVLTAESARDLFGQMHLNQAEVVRAFDRLCAAWAANDEPAIANIIQEFVEQPSVRSAFQHWARDAGVPGSDAMIDAVVGAATGGGGGGSSSSGGGGGRQSQREAIIARCRARASEVSRAAGAVTCSANLAPPVATTDTRSIDDLMAFIGDAPQAQQQQQQQKQPISKKKPQGGGGKRRH